MTTITLDVPAELATRLAPRRNQLPDLLALALDLLPVGQPHATLASNATSLAYDEMIRFLAHGATSQQILAFKLSPGAQARLEELLDKNRETGLAAEEASELETYAQVNHLFILLKARARMALAACNPS
ncbi:MAG: hypothetical protein FJ011_17000 [Chloroflexi bacterium]|nr:hypothetical protein [Chloroflexota bacterium]